MKNTKGEYNYGFNWIDETGSPVGFNDVWAPNMKEARRKAKLRESKPKWITYDIIDTKGVVSESKEWFKGMLISPTSFKKLDYKTSSDRDRIGWLMTV